MHDIFTGLASQYFVPAERPDEDPFEKERMRRSMLIRRFLVFMRDIKLQFFNKNVEYKWPSAVAVGSNTPSAEGEDWNTWKAKVLRICLFLVSVLRCTHIGARKARARNFKRPLLSSKNRYRSLDAAAASNLVCWNKSYSLWFRLNTSKLLAQSNYCSN